MAALHDVVIISACRTPVGKFQGSLSDLSATQLGAIVVREATKRAKLDPKQIDECIMGNVISAGLGQNPARRSEEHTSELQSPCNLVCRLLLEHNNSQPR